MNCPHTRRKRRATTNRITTAFKAALNYAAKHHHQEIRNEKEWLIDLAPFKQINKARERWLTVEKARRLIDACPSDFKLLVQAAFLPVAAMGNSHD